MFTFDKLKCIHIEITSKCQASCPMCNRNMFGGLKNPRLVLDEWTIEEFKTIINEEVVRQLFQVMFCGHFGDPLINPDFLEMIKYLNEINPDIMINVHTNGSFHKEDWWVELAKSLPKNHVLFLGIDGLEDTHSIYRIGTDFNKIIKNAKAFIDAGGIASWEMIRFKHNQHQVEDCRKLSKELGFSYFSVKDTSRYVDDQPYKVLDKDGNFLYNLEEPTDTTVAGVSQDLVDNYKTYVKESVLECKALKITQIYLDARKKIYPCGFLGQTEMTMTDYGDIVDPLRRESDEENKEAFKTFPEIDLTKTTIKDVMNSKEWNDFFNEYIYEKKLLTCVRNCGKFSKPLTDFLEENLGRDAN